MKDNATFRIYGQFPNDPKVWTLCARTETQERAELIVEALQRVWRTAAKFTIKNYGV